MTSAMPATPCCIAPRYLAEFRCIAGACEEDCCHGWQVGIDQSTFNKLRQAMDGCRQDRERFRRFFKRNREKAQGGLNYATIALLPNGCCPFLDANRLCEIHRRFGPEHLSMVCRSYPRKKSLVDQCTELSAFLSCPEIARRCLLDPAAMELVEVEPGRIDGDAICTQLHREKKDADAYDAHLDEIRQALLNLLTQSDVPLASRLFFTACLADGLSAFFVRKSATFSPEALAEQFEIFSDPQELNALHDHFEQIDGRIDFAMLLVQQILTARLQQIPRAFVALLDQAWNNYNLLADRAPDSRQPEIDALLARTQEIYARRRNLLQGAFARRIDQYFANYALNYWFGEWYTASPNLLEHTLKLFVRLAIVRFLFFSHPALNDLVTRLGDDPVTTEPAPADRDTLDAVAVETIYRFSRGVEHDNVYLRNIQRALADKGLDPLTLLTLLLKF